MPAAPGREGSRFSSISPPVADTLPPEISMSRPWPYTPPPIPAAPSPPTASIVPPVILMLLPVLSIPPPMPAPPLSPPSAVREPSLPLSSLMVRVPSDSWPSFSRPALWPPPFSSLSPSSSMVTSWSPLTVTAALPASTGLSPLPSPSFLPLASIFRSSKVTSTLPLEVSMVTVCSSDLPVMTVSVSSTSSFSPCVTLFVPSSPAFTVMSPSAMSHRAA